MIDEVFNPIIGYRHYDDLLVSDNLSIVDKLPYKYEMALAPFEDAPEAFFEQATMVAHIFLSLEKEIGLEDKDGNSLSEMVENFKKMLINLPFVVEIFDGKDKKGQVKVARNPVVGSSIVGYMSVYDDLPIPTEIFPAWICKARDKIANESVSPKSYKYGPMLMAYAEKNNANIEPKDGQTYYYFSDSITPDKGHWPTSQCKLYIRSYYEDEKMSSLLDDLAEIKNHPHSMKVFDGELIMYWTTFPSEEFIDNLKSVFGRHGISFPGLVQDSFDINVSQEGVCSAVITASNDQSMSKYPREKGRGFYALTNEEESDFLAKYLEQCYMFGRNPLNPNRMSFTTIVDRREDGAIEIKNGQLLENMIGDASKNNIPIRRVSL